MIKELSIIIPSYKEAENLKILLPRLNDVAKELVDDNFEILIIDTQMPLDDTAMVCKINNVTYVPRQMGNNYGDAVKTGIKTAEGKYIIFMDADGSHSPDFIKKLYTSRDIADVIVASRYIKGGNTDNPAILILMSLILNVIYRVILGLKCKDVSNSFKLYKSNLLKQIDLKSENFDIVEEILVKLLKLKKNLSFHEIPFHFEKRCHGTTKRHLLPFIVSFIFTLFKLRMIREK